MKNGYGPERRALVGFAHRFRPTYAGANMGHPCRSVRAAAGLRGRFVISHISRKTSEMPRISCTQLWIGPRVRLSLRKGAGSSGNPRNYTGNRGCGAPGCCGGDRMGPALPEDRFLWGELQIPPLRSSGAPVGMTRRGSWLNWEAAI